MWETKAESKCPHSGLVSKSSQTLTAGDQTEYSDIVGGPIFCFPYLDENQPLPISAAITCKSKLSGLCKICGFIKLTSKLKKTDAFKTKKMVNGETDCSVSLQMCGYLDIWIQTVFYCWL